VFCNRIVQYTQRKKMYIRRFLGDLGSRNVPYTYNPEVEIQNILGYFFKTLCELLRSYILYRD